MSKKVSSILIGVSGEYFVAAELSRRGYVASITLRNTRGIDIVASNEDGKLDGLATKWYENGQKSEEGTYKDGKYFSSKSWDEDGNEIDCSEL